MEQYIIKGGNPLVGEVVIGGAKNAALPVLAAAVMTDGKCMIDNMPDVRDINVLLQAMQEIFTKCHLINLPILKPFLRVPFKVHFSLIQCFFQSIPCCFVYILPFVSQFFSHPSHYPVKIQFCPVTLQTPVNPDSNLSFLSAGRLL